MDSLMQKLMMSKAIMDKSDTIGRGNVPQGNIQLNDDGDVLPQPKLNYNIPQEFMGEGQTTKPIAQPKTPTVDSIKNSKLPDEIKKLMIEHPINPVPQQSNVISDEVVKKATKMMKEQGMISSQTKDPSGVDKNMLREMVEDSVRKVLKESGMLPSSEEPTNDVFQFKVGKHIFEGKVTKIKKVQ